MRRRPRRPLRYLLVLTALPVAVLLWGSWAELGAMTELRALHPLPGLADHLTLDLSLTPAVSLLGFLLWVTQLWSRKPRVLPRRGAAAMSAVGLIAVAGYLAIHTAGWSVASPAPAAVLAAVSCTPILVAAAAALLWGSRSPVQPE
ncbi:hypothetical protein ACFXHA_43245 [Nocardia sp. NPDC059240]|uniref:hypothetical protein n=1 Tax=Nocardia sp. NPDC059240 TaxID=3346786 RepID=UPI0036A0285A